MDYKFNHMGVPVTHSFDGEIDLPHLKMTVSDHKSNPYGIQLQGVPIELMQVDRTVAGDDI